MRNQPFEVWQAQRDAPRGRRKILPSDMDEYGAAAPAHAWSVVVADDDDKIVEAVRSPQVLCARGVGVTDQSVVVAIFRVIAPAVVLAQGR